MPKQIIFQRQDARGPGQHGGGLVGLWPFAGVDEESPGSSFEVAAHEKTKAAYIRDSQRWHSGGAGHQRGQRPTEPAQ